jgi:antitoxin ParD1/3/4
MGMTSLNISLPSVMKQYLETRVKEGSYSTPSEYIRALVREDQKRRAKEHIEELLLAGASSGTPVPADAHFWKRVREQLRQAPTTNTVKRPCT